ncbi:alpha/beta hydrolase [Solidesulfovibrio fructosivorans]|uniref:alpha/beta hydrolase n=1 Tax=Solidesulfovibrio fructosivorans TaxID=878 RepID=UPI001F1F4CAB|nr:alpha/beta hydrolase [Solidesulfovibrio fructosivorans]
MAALAQSGGTVLAGWSTGAHMIVKHAATLLPRFERVVLFAPFARFGDSLPGRITRAMAAGMAADAEATVRSFWKNCGVPGEPVWNPDWASPLAVGLDYLLRSEATSGPVAAGNVTVFHGDADRIVRRPAVRQALALLEGANFREFSGGHYPDPAVLGTALSR